MKISLVDIATREDVDRAMEAAKKAFKPWAAVPYAERQKAVLAFADGLEAEKEAFSKFLTQEQGKPASAPSLELLFFPKIDLEGRYNLLEWS